MGKNFVIENKRASMVELPGKLNEHDLVVKKGLMLAPGENAVPEAEWKRVREHRTVKMYLNAGILKDLGQGEAKPLGIGLDALTKPDAMRKIAGCNSVEILKKWHLDTNDRALKIACTKQINSLEPSTEETE
jgi:hypothetical protein